MKWHYSFTRKFTILNHNKLLIMAKYIERLKDKVKIKKFDSNQPIGAWVFVVVLNIVGFAGYYYLKVNHIQLGS